MKRNETLPDQGIRFLKRQSKQSTAKKRSLKTKITLQIGLMCSAIIFAGLMLTFVMSINLIRSSTNKWLDSTSLQIQTSITNWIDANMDSVKVTKAYLDSEKDPDERNTYLGKIKSQFATIPYGFYLTYNNGTSIYYPGALSVPSDFDPSNTEWYQLAINNKDIQFTNTYIDTATKKLCVSLSIALSDNSGVLGADLFLDEISSIISNVDIGEGGVGLLLNADNIIIASNDDSLINQTLTNTYPAAADLADSSSNTTESVFINGRQYTLSVQHINNADWTFLILIPENILYKDTFTILNVSLLAMLACLALLFGSLHILLKRLLKPILAVNAFMGQVADGNLSDRMNHTDQTEIGMMMDSINTSVNSIQSVVTETKNAIETLSEQSYSTQTVVEKLQASSTDNAHSIESMSDMMDQMVSSVNSVAEMSSDVNNSVSYIVEKGNNAKDSLDHAVSTTEDGAKEMNILSAKILDIKSSMADLSLTVKTAETLTGEINKIVGLIQEIASRTNLLALNASIEAARAGESGKGFSVVASEIKNLAESAASSADDIAKLLTQVDRIIETTVSQTADNVSQIDTSVETVHETQKSFTKINESVTYIKAQIDEILNDIANVDESAQTLAAVAEEQNASAEEIASSLNEINEVTRNNMITSNELEDNVQKVLKVTKQLSEVITAFR
ncbi:MAG: methyl-accepting chemotaxis protein [Lachnospiraceae bacterium]|nr:methyl-accepting chemotaxis protein [Lachnospiraceae bacterium]